MASGAGAVTAGVVMLVAVAGVSTVVVAGAILSVAGSTKRG